MPADERRTSLRRRYNDLAERFRALWAFHHFLRRVHRIRPDVGVVNLTPWLRDIYSSLKSIRQGLAFANIREMEERLDDVGVRLAMLTGLLLEEDARFSAALFRTVFHPLKEHDDKLLFQLLSFFLYSYGRHDWTAERLDKVDFLATALARGFQVDAEVPASVDRARLRSVAVQLWTLLGVSAPDLEVIERHLAAIEEARAEALETETLDQLIERSVVPRYRSFKHGLGLLFFQPEVLVEILETNLALREVIDERLQKEEEQIVSDYRRILELEEQVPVDEELGRELVRLRRAVEEFEEELQSEEVRLTALAQIKRGVRALLPRLTTRAPAAAQSEEEADRDTVGAAVSMAGPELGEETKEDLIGGYRHQMTMALGATDSERSPEEACLTPAVSELRIEPREAVAYRRLQSEEDWDRDKERFLLDAAAMRLRINEQARALRDLTKIGAADEEQAILAAAASARLTLRLADTLLRRFDYLIDHAVLDGEFKEAYQLQISRTRLLRDHSGLWLLAWKPFLSRRSRA